MSSETIYGSFKPTYLYIKQHSVTGLLYFGKTVYDPVSYLGSGVHWQRHIKKHGKEHVVTLWNELFTDRTALTLFALQFSEEMNIVKSTSWANIKEENGLDGGSTKHSDETKIKIGNANRGKLLGRVLSEETRAKMCGHQPMLGKTHTESAKQRQRDSQKGITKPRIECQYCGKIGGVGGMNRHIKTCKFIPVNCQA